MASELHVSSLLVHGLAPRLAAISDAIATLPGAEVHASDPDGKLIVTLEAGSTADLQDRIADINALEGVLAATLVYHQVEPLDAENSE